MITKLVASNPLDAIAIDSMLLESTSDRTKNILVITDVFSKFTVAIQT